MWERAGEVAKRMTADIRRKNKEGEMLSNQNTPEESSGDKDNVGKEHMVAGDCKNKNNKKGESKDEEHLKKYRKHAEKRNGASMSSW